MTRQSVFRFMEMKSIKNIIFQQKISTYVYNLVTTKIISATMQCYVHWTTKAPRMLYIFRNVALICKNAMHIISHTIQYKHIYISFSNENYVRCWSVYIFLLDGLSIVLIWCSNLLLSPLICNFNRNFNWFSPQLSILNCTSL